MAGIYVVIMALSWWIKALETPAAEEDPAWTAVEDLLWALAQMQITVATASQNSQGIKRGHDDSDIGKRVKRLASFPNVTKI
jgi:hypothetical protein